MKQKRSHCPAASDNIITLLATDGGKRFNPNQKRCGIGINNMISRAESINSEPGKGYVLQALFPLQ